MVVGAFAGAGSVPQCLRDLHLNPTTKGSLFNLLTFSTACQSARLLTKSKGESQIVVRHLATSMKNMMPLKVQHHSGQCLESSSHTLASGKPTPQHARVSFCSAAASLLETYKETLAWLKSSISCPTILYTSKRQTKPLNGCATFSFCLPLALFLACYNRWATNINCIPSVTSVRMRPLLKSFKQGFKSNWPGVPRNFRPAATLPSTALGDPSSHLPVAPIPGREKLLLPCQLSNLTLAVVP